MASTLDEVNQIFKTVFEDESLIISADTSASDIPAWDSLNHVILISEIEKHFNVSFELDELIQFENVGDIISGIEKKTTA